MDLNLENFSPEILAGQKLITGIFGKELTEETKDYLEKIKPGGLILFSRNIENKAQLKKLNNDIFDFYEELKLPIPFLSIDQEGGSVARLKEPEFKELGALEYIDTPEKAKTHAKEMSQIIGEFGFNMNMAPVLDIASLEEKSIMKSRSFPGDAKNIAELGIVMIHEYMENKIIPVGKHFPGIGGTILDSHLCLPVFEKDYEFMEKNDLYPFLKAVNAKLPAIMFSHILYEKLDDKWPASLSEIICRDILRDKMEFNGITMTDDLDMKAITSDPLTAAKQIVIADQDIALICHSMENSEIIKDFFMEEIEKENIEVKNSVKRIFDLKNMFL